MTCLLFLCVVLMDLCAMSYADHLDQSQDGFGTNSTTELVLLELRASLQSGTYSGLETSFIGGFYLCGVWILLNLLFFCAWLGCVQPRRSNLCWVEDGLSHDVPHQNEFNSLGWLGGLDHLRPSTWEKWPDFNQELQDTFSFQTRDFHKKNHGLAYKAFEVVVTPQAQAPLPSVSKQGSLQIQADAI